ncbi:MAG: adenylate/guanylate cyclase domain-containing protein [Saprospiraceae bacterium]
MRLNESLKNELDKPLELGMGIHCGQVVVGEMGYRNVTSITAIGDVANTSSRLEGESKNLGCELVVSDDVARQAGVGLS